MGAPSYIIPFEIHVLRRIREGQKLIPGTATSDAIEMLLARGLLLEAPERELGVAVSDRGRAELGEAQ